MNNLWKKEATEAEYVDLFASMNNYLIDLSFISLTTQKSRKDNQLSTEWRLKGNKLFRQEIWDEALKCYNQSLCFAEVGTENVALAYSNRSACFFNLRLYNEALADIELAKNANLPDRLIPKLDQRKHDSLNLMSIIAVTITIDAMELDYEADKNFPCMANVVEIKYNEEFGRHLVAKCDIPAGRTVLVESDFPKICDNKFGCHPYLIYTNRIACPNCPDALFCSQDCMNDNKIHNLVCGSFFSHLPHDMRFEIKTLLMAINNFSSVDRLMKFVEEALLESPETLPTSLTDSKSHYHFFFKLATSRPFVSCLDMAYKIYKIVMSLPKVSILFVSDRKKRFLMHLLVHHLLVSNTNAVGDGDLLFVANICSLANHSCAPNLIDMSHSRTGNIYRVTKRPVKKGEQLSQNYKRLTSYSSAERKQEIKSLWGIDCKCEICEPTHSPLDRKLITSDPNYKYVMENQHNFDESGIIQRKCIEFLNKYGRSVWSLEIESVSIVYTIHLSKCGKLV